MRSFADAQDGEKQKIFLLYAKKYGIIPPFPISLRVLASVGGTPICDDSYIGAKLYVKGFLCLVD